MNYKDGQYYYAPFRRRWGVWQHHTMKNGIASATFIAEFATKEEARRYVYEQNGWNNN